MNDESKKEESCSSEECEWCGTTGDIKKNNRYYWGAVILIVIFLIIVYILAVNK
ncbi:hypothetical protein BMS3Abin07_02436 [bacterium BMS3Abin07]|nr:hypothetical protein BMS3Abin07_02436 [bacterium BMS3Abin07]GBE31498.1 hypothetical protein BMS3Bbin05_00399 [bacterium BMS3Bbin05]